MSDTEAQHGLHELKSGFVTTHCRTCAASQTIIRADKKLGTYCLLLREWVTSKTGEELIYGCDRYEVKGLENYLRSEAAQ